MSLRSLLIGATAAAISLSLAGAPAVRAENRVALVIGNSAYQAVPELPNPVNDAKAMAELLGSAGFEVVTAPDLGQTEMRRAVGEFAANLASKGPDTVALLYYAGHGVQVDGENYLVPIDARIRQEADVPLQAVRLADVMNALAAVPSKSRIVMLDACRNNPFSEINKTSGRGLAIADAPNGSIISYATAPGFEAEDGDGRNSPYTTAVLTVAKEGGLPIEQAFKRVRALVHRATDGRQTPWESSSLTSDFSFFTGQPGSAGAQASAPAAARLPPPPPPPPSAGRLAAPAALPALPAALATARPGGRSVDSWRQELQGRSAEEAYDIVLAADTVEAYQAYLSLYATPPLGPRVRTLLDRRVLMVAWYVAVTVNTPASYQAFLASYPGSDFAATAQRLMTRALNRTAAGAGANLASAAMCPCTPAAPAAPAPLPRDRRTGAPSTGNQAIFTPAAPALVAPPATAVSPPAVVVAPPVVVRPPPPPVVVVRPPRIPRPPRVPETSHRVPPGSAGQTRAVPSPRIVQPRIVQPRVNTPAMRRPVLTAPSRSFVPRQTMPVRRMPVVR